MSKLPEIKNAKRQAYPSDLSDREWEIIEELLPELKGFGRPSEKKSKVAMVDS